LHSDLTGYEQLGSPSVRKSPDNCKSTPMSAGTSLLDKHLLLLRVSALEWWALGWLSLTKLTSDRTALKIGRSVSCQVDKAERAFNFKRGKELPKALLHSEETSVCQYSPEHSLPL
jgi:hypothetical protein